MNNGVIYSANTPPGVAILIPTYKRSDRLLRVYENAKQSSPLVTNVYFVVENDDQESIHVLQSHRLLYFVNERTRGSNGALNTAYQKTTEKYFFTGSDDLDFKPGWLELALKKMVGPIQVVGINDLHDLGVQRGKYTLLFLVDREYIQKRSGVVDQENIVLSESYYHTWADREFYDTAKMRGVLAVCLESVVEHLHWGYGLSLKDETYAKQDKKGVNNGDARNYLRRRPLVLASAVM